jgi:glutaredoxin-related protein
MTTRKQLDPAKIHPDAAAKLEDRHPETIAEIEAALEANTVVVVGMAQNPHVKNVRKALAEAGIDFKYLEYGSYFSEWARRLTIKMWSGWPTFPQVFLRGQLIGGEDLTKAAIANGTLSSTSGKAATSGEKVQAGLA